ncbi:hypothetical protein [Amycolatopsis sp. H20-H5]|uniref:hypothetical protein n=1 Tax=Amycolatopsis sp. H20-H5 TaxID=3046309 RepID=UPI002DB6998B|nr:hypothetical protein [Amycolatopsis sp. H20-H5]MEC3977172.1 hypothetical protein [Amycolatopsis sp. H20-H5]
MGGIDLGTHGTSFGWAYWSPSAERPGRIVLFEGWPGGRPGVDVKTPTALLVNEKGEVLAWGHQAFAQAARCRAGRPGSGVRLVHGFKMALLPRSDAERSRSSEIGLADNEPHAEKLIAAFLSYVYRTALAELRVHIPDLGEDEIRWCVTVPAMWGDHEKHLVRQAAYEAGFPREEGRLLLALEPDAVAHNAQASGIAYVIDADTGQRGTLEKNSRFMVVDCGGGTIDITCYTTDGDGYLTEIDREGIAQGSLYVNRALTDLVLVQRLGGADEYQRLREIAPHALEELVEEWELKKRNVSHDTDDTIFLSLKVSLAKHLSEEVLDRLSAAQDGDDESIWISVEEARSAFEAVIPDILALVDRKLEDMTALTSAAGKPHLVLLAGGFAESAYLRHRIAQHLRGRALVAVTPQPRVDVVEGAVRFAYNPKVRARRSQYTYGVAVSALFEHGKDPIESLYRPRRGGELCDKRFSVFINAGDIVPVAHVVSKPFRPVESDDRYVAFDFYRTKERKPRYTDNEGCEEFGSCQMTIDLADVMHLDLSKRGMRLYFTFGETELHVRAVLDGNGEEQQIDLQFSTR